ncbi:hypothetical protein KZP23_17785 [Echinicola marina]|uniref:hypothetical protein n=1 Tax=Echinicola marina TaxID=2859768 RepID=UPI001CF70AE7|nr:hypothetical protein [Echinicola marina]UCS92524.1 hypothetical protein KZP23_17785 [Echinicola marina]
MTSNQAAYRFSRSKIGLTFIIVLIILIPVVVIPGLSHLAWKFSTPKNINVVIMDKTVSDQERLEHRSLFWAMKHLNIRREDGQFYQFDKDYLGFYPQENGKHKIKSLQQYRPQALDSLTQAMDILYFADTYGVYEADFRNNNKNAYSEKIYGGLSQKDVDFLSKSIDQEKLVIAEFNTMGAPTSPELRLEFEEIMKIKWSGWISRYFDELDTLINNEIPNWLIENYKQQHQGEWLFKGAAQVFVNETGRIEILEHKKDMVQQVPLIVSTLKSQQKYDLPQETNYPYWFEIIRIDKNYEVISYFDLTPTESGLEKLQSMGLPRYFPASMIKKNGKGNIFYFTGDFSDNPISMSSTPFLGIARLQKLVNDKTDYSNRNSFYWNYFYPLIQNILEDYQK